METPVTLAHLRVSKGRADAILRRRELGHWMSMRSLPVQMGDHPRSRANLLWHLSADGTLLVQSDYSRFTPERIDTDLEHVSTVRELADGDRLTIETDVVRLYTPSPSHLKLPPALQGSKIRLRPVIVPGEWVNEWAEKKLSSWGFNPLHVSLSPTFEANIRRKEGYPALTITADVSVTDADAANTALREGRSKLKAYGLGLIRTL